MYIFCVVPVDPQRASAEGNHLLVAIHEARQAPPVQRRSRSSIFFSAGKMHHRMSSTPDIMMSRPSNRARCMQKRLPALRRCDGSRTRRIKLAKHRPDVRIREHRRPTASAAARSPASQLLERLHREPTGL